MEICKFCDPAVKTSIRTKDPTNRRSYRHTWEAWTMVKTATPKNRKRSTIRNDRAPAWWVLAWLIHAPNEEGAPGSVKIPACNKKYFLWIRRQEKEKKGRTTRNTSLNSKLWDAYLWQQLHQLSTLLKLLKQETERNPTCFSALEINNIAIKQINRKTAWHN